jgi:hypothetical protein
MQEQIGITAGAIWQVLDAEGEMSLTDLKKAVNGKTPVFDWAVGWLAREDKIVIMAEKRSFRVGLKGRVGLEGRVGLKGTQARAAGAS